MTYIEPTLWAQKQFGQAHLNDPRRTQRLVALAASLAEQPGVPVSKLIISPAEMEGAYRFIRNEQIKAEDIAEAGFYVTAQEALEQQT
ncbi:transposase DNA-binding-containing protein, partial [Vibrio splendidus]